MKNERMDRNYGEQQMRSVKKVWRKTEANERKRIKKRAYAG